MDTVYTISDEYYGDMGEPVSYYLTEESAHKAAKVFESIGQKVRVTKVNLGGIPYVRWFAGVSHHSEGIRYEVNSWEEVDLNFTQIAPDWANSVGVMAAPFGQYKGPVNAIGTGHTKEEAVRDANRLLDEYLKEKEDD